MSVLRMKHVELDSTHLPKPNHRNRFRIPVMVLVFTMIQLLMLTTGASAQQVEPEQDSTREGYLIQVPLPVTDAVSERVERQIQQVAEQVTSVVAAGQRPVLVLEFDTSNGATGQGSELGDCLDIAILLTDRKLQSLQSVAYIPGARGFSDNDKGPTSELKGHAVLIALACNEIVMHESSSMGEAGIDIRGDSQLEWLNYSNIVGRRSRIAPEMVHAMVDKRQSLFQIETLNGDIDFVDQQGIDKLDKKKLAEWNSINASGSLANFSSTELKKMRVIRNRVSSRADLAMRLDLDRDSLTTNSGKIGGDRIPVQLPIKSFIDSREADWSLRMLSNHMASNPDTNMVIVRLNADGGELEPCLRIARELAGYDPNKVFTVAYIESNATGPTSLIALACDQVVMQEDSMIGGAGDVPVSEQDLEDSRALIKRFAEQKEIDWSLPVGFVDADLTVSQYKNTKSGQKRLLCEEERLGLSNPKDWSVEEDVELGGGLSDRDAMRLNIAQDSVKDFEQLKLDFQLSETPTELEPSPTDKWIENVARELANPWIAAWLLFGAVFLLSTEMSHPGIGIPGFLGTICLMLFFWSQYLDGNANWLEILLFVVGVVFVILEVFVIPGFGIFGIGGLLMIVVGIVLASQTFIIPRNSEELAKLPGSLSMVLAASSGFLAGIFFIRKYLTTMPMFRRIMLNPPGADESVSPEQRNQRESLVNRSHMVGKTGTTTTPLVPAGKAQIGNELVDVITDGRMLERDQLIKVVEVVGNRVVVESVDT